MKLYNTFCISAIFAVPEEICAVQYAKAILKYSQGSASNGQKLKEIHFIDKNVSIIKLIQKTFQAMIAEKKETDYNVMRYVTEHRVRDTGYSTSSARRTSNYGNQSQLKQTETPVSFETPECFEMHAGNESHVNVYIGNILEAHRRHVTAIVCSDDDMGRGNGGIAVALKNKAQSFSYETEKRKAFFSKTNAGEVVVSAGQGTGFQTVLHAILWSTGRNVGQVPDQKEVVIKAYKNIFETCRRGLTSVALPLLGTGKYSYRCVVECKVFCN